MNPHHTDFASFCRLVLGEKEANGAAITALLDAYTRLALEVRLGLPSRPETLDYLQPFQVYEIRNLKTGKAYVGRAAQGFLHRYTGGTWWVGHHNQALLTDAILFGLTAFRVSVFQCTDSDDMCAVERLSYDSALREGRGVYNSAVPSPVTPAPYLPVSNLTRVPFDTEGTGLVPECQSGLDNLSQEIT